MSQPGPLHGYRIVDLTSMISGPLATMILADQGADVIKVENPQGGGDHTRAAANRRGGFSASFVNNNRNKRSIALDLKNEAARAALLRLVAGADVFVQNFRPGVVERMGLGEDAIRAVAPSIIYVSISGFGESGPYSHKPVYDPIIQALSGLATVQAGSDTERPRLVRTILPDKLTAVTASQAITAALLARERTGQGQHIRLSMLDAVVAFLWASDMGSQTFVGDELPQQDAASFIDLIYQTADGHISVAVQTDREWTALTRALDRPDWLEDPRFATPALRHKHINTRLQMTQDVLMTRTAGEWLDRLTAAGVPCAPVLTRTEMIRHPQVVENGIVVHAEHPAAGTLRQARPGGPVLRHARLRSPGRAGAGGAHGTGAGGAGLRAGGDRGAAAAPPARRLTHCTAARFFRYGSLMPDDLYDRDVLAWSEHQADLLRRLARGERVDDLDWEHVVEEIERRGAVRTARGSDRSAPDAGASSEAPGLAGESIRQPLAAGGRRLPAGRRPPVRPFHAASGSTWGASTAVRWRSLRMWHTTALRRCHGRRNAPSRWTSCCANGAPRWNSISE